MLTKFERMRLVCVRCDPILTKDNTQLAHDESVTSLRRRRFFADTSKCYIDMTSQDETLLNLRRRFVDIRSDIAVLSKLRRRLRKVMSKLRRYDVPSTNQIFIPRETGRSDVTHRNR